MGIKNLSQVIGETSVDVPLSMFGGCRIAFDGAAFVFIHLAVANKDAVDLAAESDLFDDETYHERLMPFFQKQVKTALEKYLRNQIIPIFVFDGTVPIEKTRTREKRKLKRETVENKIEEMRKRILEVPMLERSPEMIVNLKKLLRQDLKPSKIEFGFMRELLKSLNIPVFEAPGEGEKLASWFCKEDLVTAVFSTDTDCLVYGAKRVIIKSAPMSYDMEKMMYEDNVKLYELDRVLNHLELKFDSFVDLCIMAGCDYNENIPNIAIVKSLKYIKTYNKIEDVLNAINKDGSILEFETCRKLFDNTASPFMMSRLELEMKLELGKITEETSRFLQRYNMDGWIVTLLDYYSRIEMFPRPVQFVIM